jgi:pSer/pThr/pTyr-binding forkhead associated (FHA) protein
MRASLTVLSGPFAGQKIAVSHGKLLIGREVDCHLRPESALISRHHCALLLDDYTLRVRDLGSRNGTFVNGRRIGNGETILISGDHVSVGDMACQVDLDPAAADAEESTSPVAQERTVIYDGDTVQPDSANLESPPPPTQQQATA